MNLSHLLVFWKLPAVATDTISLPVPACLPRGMVQVMGKNTHQPLFRITVSTLDGVEMSFLVKRGYTVNTLSPRLWNQMLKRNIVSRNAGACLDLACDGVKMDWSKKLKDYNIRDDVDVLPALVVVLRRPGT